MFYLRLFSKDQTESNITLGSRYTHIHRHTSYDEFCKMFKSYYAKDHVADLDEGADDDTKNCFAFVWGDSGETIPIRKGRNAYIMTSDGKTFANVSQ